MLIRTNSFFDFFPLDAAECRLVERLAARSAEMAKGMTHRKDYEALGAAALWARPRRIFEIGTYLGVTSDFFLELLPDCTVVSIAYQNWRWNPFRKIFNNSELSKKQVGSLVTAKSRIRFTQLYGDSHGLDPDNLLRTHGDFDLIFVDGDHSADGVRQDTELAKRIMSQSGIICWHDANPKERYLAVRQFLEHELPLKAIATRDDYVGGIACWSSKIEAKLECQLR